MAELSSKVRLVRCPKCGNLLPEMPDYSVYECGGCGAVLRAKKGDDVDGGNIIPPPERLESEKPGTVSGKSALASRRDSKENTVSDAPRGVAPKINIIKEEEVPEKQGVENGCLEESPTFKFSQSDVNGSTSKIIKQKTSSSNGPPPPPPGRSRKGEGEAAVKIRNSSHAGEGPSPSSGYYCYHPNGNHRVVAPPPPRMNPVESTVVERGDNSKNNNKPTREELLMKLEELKEQLSQACDVNDHNDNDVQLPRKHHPYTADSDDWFPDHPARYHGTARQFGGGDSTDGYGVSRGRYFEDSYYDPAVPVPAMDRSEYSRFSAQEMASLGSSGGFETSPFGPRLFTRHHSTTSIPQRMPGGGGGGHTQNNARIHPYIIKPDPFDTHHLVSCNCYQCLPRHPLPLHPSATRRANLVPNNHVTRHHHHHHHHGAFTAHESRNITTYPRPFIMDHHQPPPLQSHSRWHHQHPSDQFGGGYYPHSRPQRVVLPDRPCRPVAGGAPFVTCHNCSELLELPKKVSHLEKSQWKVCCGGCSSVITFTVGDNDNLLVPVEPPQQPQQPSKENNPQPLDSSEEMVPRHDKPYDPHGGMRRDVAGFHYEEFDDSNYTFQFVEKEERDPPPPPPTSATAQGCCLNNSLEKSQVDLPHFRLLSTTTSSGGTSEDDDEEEDIFCPGGNNNLVNDHFPDEKKAAVAAAAAAPPVSPPPSHGQDQFDFQSNHHRAVTRCGNNKGSLSSRSDQDRSSVPGKAAVVPPPLRQNSLQDNNNTLATEMEIHHSDAAASAAAVVNGNNKEDGGQATCKKRVDSFLTGIIKKSFRDLSKTNSNNGGGENWKRSVVVNGHVIPDKLVKKAEKLAGPISPGQYWYDFRAGFWGVTGGPCLGIIPPHIEEFHHPMDEKCAGGNTDVFVNGRELHQKDLDLLASRGLPTMKHRSYVIEISGRVLDEDTGEELDSLGKLAPTVEKVKHGFGMSTPKMSV